jgi:crossover junction endodeoxyribonuclease RuvC
MIILGIDPGSQRTGYGLIEKTIRGLKHIDNGCLDLTGDHDFATRLKLLFEQLETVVNQFKPQAMAIEQVFYAKNAVSSLKLGQARGVALLAGARAGLPIHEYAPTQVKMAMVGHGRADKSQIQRMVKLQFGLPQPPEENAADALSVAFCHAQLNCILQIDGQKTYVRR